MAIVILNWNGKHFLERFLPILLARTLSPAARVVIADNASSDGSLEFLREKYPTLQVLAFDKNYGFTGGYNKALRQVGAAYYVLLNSDVEVGEGWLEPLLEAMEENPQMGACMPKMLSLAHPRQFEYAGACGGFIDRLGFPFCRGRILSRIEEDHGQYDAEVPVFWASGACLMVRSEVYHRLGGLDEAFFAHMEEIDFCWRLQLNGYQVWCIPRAVVWHVGGGTLPNNSPRKLFFNYRNNLYMLYKNLPRKRCVTLLALRLGIDCLSGVVYLLQGKWSYAQAVGQAHRAFFSGRGSLQRTPATLCKRPVWGVYRGWVILRFFLSRGRLTFSMLDLPAPAVAAPAQHRRHRRSL